MAKIKEIYQGWYLSEVELISYILGVRKGSSRQLSQNDYDDNDVIKRNREWKWKVYLIPWIIWYLV